MTAPPSERQIRERLVREVAEAARLPPESVDVQEPFASYNISSIEAVQLVAVLETWLGLELDATLLWDHSTIEALARHLAQAVKSVPPPGAALP
jgi:acyl carrier protein